MTLVTEFHEAFDLPAPDTPPLAPDADVIRLRMRLIREEFKEVMAEFSALLATTDPAQTIDVYRRLLKELCDLRYVAEGAAGWLSVPGWLGHLLSSSNLLCFVLHFP
jgi:hypothetical protein